MAEQRSQSRRAYCSRVSYGKPHTSGTGWYLTLDCGHRVYERIAYGVGTQIPCPVCNAPEPPEVEGCGGDAILDRCVP